MLLDAILALGVLLGLSGLGYFILRLIHPRLSSIGAITIAYPLGSGTFTFLLFLLSWIGIPINLTTVVVSYIICVILFVLPGLWNRRNPDQGEKAAYSLAISPSVPWGNRIAYLSVLSLWLLAAYFSLQRGYSTWDAIGIWGVKGMGIALEGTILAGSHWGSHGLSYPLNIPLQIAIFRLLGEDLLMGSKSIFPMFYLSLLLGVYTLLRRKSGWQVGLIGTLLVGTTPIIFEHGTIGYANLPFTTYLVLGLMSLLRGASETDTRLHFLGGLLLGLASWTRPEGAFLVGSILIVIYFGQRAIGLKERTSPRHSALPALVLIMIWQVFMLLNGAQGLLGEALRSAGASMRAGDLNLSAVYWTARFAGRQVIDPGFWGLILPVGLLFVIFRWREIFSRTNKALMFLVWPAVTAGLSIFTYYYLVSFQQDIQYLLGTSVNRLFMPVWVMGFLGVLGTQGGKGVGV